MGHAVKVVARLDSNDDQLFEIIYFIVRAPVLEVVWVMWMSRVSAGFDVYFQRIRDTEFLPSITRFQKKFLLNC